MNKPIIKGDRVTEESGTPAPSSPRDMARRLKGKLQRVFGARLRGVVLYGSAARGEAEPESDVDVLVLLEGPVDYGSDLRASIEALYPLTLEWERPISPEPTDIRDFEAGEWPLYERARADGIPA